MNPKKRTPLAMALVASGLTAILALIAVPSVAAAQTDIHKVDFRNFTYPANCSGQPGSGADRTVRVTNGKFEEGKAENDDLVSFTIAKIEYGDLLGTGSDQAAVLAGCNTGSNFEIAQIFIYDMPAGASKPKLLAHLLPADWGKGQEDNGSSFAVSKMVVTKNDLAITFYAGGSHACPDWDVTAEYKWIEKQFARGTVERKHHSCQ
jgi:hypothetical protein